MTPSLLPYCVPRIWDFSFRNRYTCKSEGALSGECGDEEGFQIHIQSQQSCHLVTYGQERCPARGEHRESVFLASFLRFPGEANQFVCIILKLHSL